VDIKCARRQADAVLKSAKIRRSGKLSSQHGSRAHVRWQVGGVVMVVLSAIALLLAWASATRPFCDQPSPACKKPSWGYLHVGVASIGFVLAFLCLATASNQRWAARFFAAWLVAEATLALIAVIH
jgi:hypothetical protein